MNLEIRGSKKKVRLDESPCLMNGQRVDGEVIKVVFYAVEGGKKSHQHMGKRES